MAANLLLAGALACGVAAAAATDSLYELHATDIHGADFDLGAYANKVTLVVNVATY